MYRTATIRRAVTKEFKGYFVTLRDEEGRVINGHYFVRYSTATRFASRWLNGR